jgi:acetylornithine deacetylase/succinyl-diaminopimelate desuccinylase-like protein
MGEASAFVDRNRALIDSLFDEIEHSEQTLFQRVREIAETPAPTFHEERRTRYVEKAFRTSGLKDVQSLPKGSVLGFTKSRNEEDTLVLAAHIDSVFPEETDVTTRIEGMTLHGPGTGDNAANVAAIITLAEILNRLEYSPRRNIAFCGTVREEGIGNLGGIAEVVDTFSGIIGTVIAVDGRMTSLMNRSLAIRRYAVTVRGPGGHSWAHFGNPSAIHELARIVTALVSLEPPAEPKTTFNVGTIHGGRSVNAIAQEAVAEVDLRSLETEHVEKLKSRLLAILKEVPSKGVTAEARLIGTRPAATQPLDSPLVQTALDVARFLGIEVELAALSTDAALSLDRGIPSISVGTYQGRGVHTLEEQIDLSSLVPGLKWLALIVLILVSQAEDRV